MIRYRFTRTVTLDAPPGPIFDAIVATEQWPAWWRQLRTVETLDGEPDDPLGRRQRFVVAAPAGYSVEVVGRFVTLDRPRLLAAELDGDLVGHGRLRFGTARGGATTLHYLLDVRAAKPWMALLGPILRPLLERNHERVVDEAFAGLVRKVAADLDR